MSRAAAERGRQAATAVAHRTARRIGASLWGARMLYMVVEHFRDGDPLPVYRRFRDQGRLAPEGLRYVASWVTEDFRRCFQVMECDDPQLLARWMARWEDLVDFEVVPVVTSAEAAAAIAPRL
jgi:hypothetical protein